MKKTFTKLICNLLIPAAFVLFAGNALQAQWVLEVDIDGSTDRFPVGTAAFGPLVLDTLSGPAAIGMDGSANPQLGCGALTTDLTGSFGILRRGDCSFKQKALNAQNAGAIGLIVCNTLDELLNMPDTDEVPNEINIQTVLLSSSDCRVIREAVESGSEVSVSLFEVPLTIVWGGPNDPNSTFDGGLNDWTTGGPNADLWFHSMPIPSTPVPAGWGSSPTSHYDYSLNPNVDKFPRFYGTGTDRRIISRSLDNGFAMLDVDTWNNNNDGTFGSNLANAELISPVMDLSGFEGEALALTFTQSARFCCGAGTQLTVQVSTDGFQTFTSFNARGDQAVNAIERSNNVTFSLLEAFEGIDDLSNVQVKFIWNTEAAHYFWMIDDVQIIGLPPVNLELDESWFPLTAVCIPAVYSDEQEMDFELRLSNVGGEDQALVEGIVQVISAATDEVLFSEVQQFNNLRRGADTVLVFDGTFQPAGLAEGDYIINYRVRTPGAVDFEPATNVISYFFRITSDIYANDDCIRTTGFGGLRGVDVFTWYWGNAYYIGSMPPETPEARPVFTGAQAALTLGGGGDWTNESVFLHLLKFNEPGPDAFNNFNTDITDEPIAHPDLTPIALAVVDPDIINQAGNGNLFELSYRDFFLLDGSQPESPIELEPEHYYFVFLQLDEDQVEPFMFVGRAAHNLNNAPARELLHLGDGYGLFQVASRRPAIRMRTEVVVNTADGPVVQDNPFLIYPVPASNELNIDLNLPTVEDVNIEVYDIQGRLLDRSLHSNIGTETIQKDVTEFRTGNYLIRIITENGVQTQQVIIVK